MKILVTGGCGFIGVNLSHALHARGHDIRVLDDESLGKRAHLEGLDVEFQRGRVQDRDVVRDALQGIEAVVHLAADTRVMDSIEDPVTNFESNVIGSFVLLDEMRRAGVGRIASASTGGAILGEAPCPVHEEILPRPVAPYGASKLAMEGYHSAFAGAYGLDCACLRFSNVYGPRSFHKGSVVAAYYRQILAGAPLTVYGDGSQIRDYVFIDDLVAGIVSALETGVSGVYQLGTGRPVSLRELIAAMAQVTGRDDLDVRFEPARAGEIHTTYCDISKAQKAFDYTPDTPLLTGLKQTWQWFETRNGA